MKEPVLTDIMRECVAKVSQKLTTTLQPLVPGMTGVHFLHGHYTEVKDRLKQKSASGSQKFNRYPLVCLFHDFPIRRGAANSSLYGEATVQMIILVHTAKDIWTDQRYDQTIKPIVAPIYDELLNQIASHGAISVSSKSKIDHTMVDRPNWGENGERRNEGSLFMDVLDGRELRNLVLPLRWINC